MPALAVGPARDFLASVRSPNADDGAPLKLSGGISITDYGARSGSGDDTAAINRAIASGARHIRFPAGTFTYVGQLTKPEGVSFVGEGMGATALTVKHPGYAGIVRGIGGVWCDMTINCSQQGIMFETERDGAGYTLYNQLSRVKLIGPGRAKAFARRATRGVLFDHMRPGAATFFNTVRDCVVTQFDIGMTFDAPKGGASSGGNANHAINNQIENYWVGYEIRSIENDIRGGFLHAASGTSFAEPTIGYLLTNGAHYNKIEAATGEPGSFAACYLAEPGTFANTIDMSGAFNYPAPSVQAGDNNILGWHGAQVGSLTEGHYYRVRFTRAFNDHTGGAYTLTWSSSAPALSGSSAGSVAMVVSKGRGGLRCRFANRNETRSGRSVNLVGIRVTARNELEAVLYVDNNGTGSSAANVNFQATGSGNAASIVHVNAFTDAGTSDPSTLKLPN